MSRIGGARVSGPEHKFVVSQVAAFSVAQDGQDGKTVSTWSRV